MYLFPISSLLFFIKSLAFRSLYYSHLCLVIHFLIVSFPKCFPLCACYLSLSVLYIPQCFSLSLLVCRIHICMFCTCPVPPPCSGLLFLARSAPVCSVLFLDFLVFLISDWFLDSVFWIVIFCTSAPFWLSTRFLNFARLLDYILYLPLLNNHFLCGVQRNYWCVLAFESLPWIPILTLMSNKPTFDRSRIG